MSVGHVAEMDWEGPKEDTLMDLSGTEDTRSSSIIPEGAHLEMAKNRHPVPWGLSSSDCKTTIQILSREQSCPQGHNPEACPCRASARGSQEPGGKGCMWIPEPLPHLA